MNKSLYADPNKCSGCNRCSYVCSAVKTGAFTPGRARIQINNFPHRGFSVPSICFQCPSAPCHSACPTGAISRNEMDVVVVDGERCIACGNCVSACPYGMIDIGEQGKSVKCDLCGGDPACVRECYPGALTFEEKSPEATRRKATQMKQRSSQGTPAEKRLALGQAILTLTRG